MTVDHSGLEDQANGFAEDLTSTVRALVADCDRFAASALADDEEGSGRISVQQVPNTGVPLKVRGDPLLPLTVSIFCSWDAPGRYIVVDNSEFKVYAGAKAKGEPLFRYDYVRWPGDDMPGAHLQVHGHRDAVAHVMSRAGTNTRRGRSRAESDAVPRMSELHFPLGGQRFRPCLEDVLEMLVNEFGVDCTSEGLEALRAARQRWRGIQLATATRDTPEHAIRALEELGYTVTWTEQKAEPTGTPWKARLL